RGLQAPRPRADAAGQDRARRRSRRASRRHPAVAWPARRRRGLPLAQPGRSSPARAIAAGLRRALCLVQERGRAERERMRLERVARPAQCRPSRAVRAARCRMTGSIAGRLFCAADAGALVVLDRDSGEVMASLPLAGEPDVLMHDPDLRRPYVAIGDPGVVCSSARDRPGSRLPQPVGVLPRQRRRGVRGTRLSSDARRIIAAQAARALAYGLGSVVIGLTLADRGLSNAAVGLVLASLLAGTALVSVLIARYGDTVGRRRCYRLLFVGMALAGTVFALTAWLPALIVAGLTGTVSTDVVESGPFTSLEQAMLPHAAGEDNPTRLFGTYNTVATLAGSLGALVALLGSSPHWLLAYPFAAGLGLLATEGISASVERGHELEQESLPPLHRSRGIVMRLSALFALDSFAGGFVPQTFIAYLFVRKYDASPQTLAITFFAIGILQALSFQAAVRFAGRIGLLRTMVFTHLPSNLLLIAVAFAPNLASAIALLLARF